MPLPILPTIIQGPAVVTHDGYTYFFQGALEVRLVRESFDVESAYGRLDTRHTSQRYEISGTPVGEMEQSGFAALFPYSVNDIGKSIFPVSPALVIYSLSESATYTFHRAALLTSPNVNLAPNKTLFDAVTFVAIGKANTPPTDAAFIKTVGPGSIGFDDFAQGKVITDIYKATFDGVEYGALDGFTVNVTTETQNIIAADIGIVDVILRSLIVNCEFAPDNRTQAELDALLGLQGGQALFPGQSYARNENDLFLQSTDPGKLKVTLKSMGAKEVDHVYEIGQHQHRRILFTARRNFTGGPQELWVFEAAGS